MAVTAVAATVAQRFLLHHAAVAAVAPANQDLKKIVVCFLACDDFQFKGIQNH